MRKIILATLLLFCAALSDAQNRLGLYGKNTLGKVFISYTGLGPASLYGDIGGTLGEQAFYGLDKWSIFTRNTLNQLSAKYVFTNNIGIRAAFLNGSYEAADTEKTIHPDRGLAHKTTLLGGYLAAELVLFGGPFSERFSRHNLYLYGGAGFIQSQSEVTLFGEKHDGTTPLRDDKVENLIRTPVIPIGIGYQFEIMNRWWIGAEFSINYMQSDFVDGIKTRASKSNDMLISLLMSISYEL